MEYGWATGGLFDANIPYINLGATSLSLNIITGMGGNAAAVAGARTLRASLFKPLIAGGATHLLVPLGTNDFANGQTGAQVYQSMQLLGNELGAMGIKVIPCTLQPRTASNGTSLPAGEPNTFTNRQSLNALIVANNGVGYGYYDLAAVTQNSGATDAWRTDLRTATGLTITNGGSGYAASDYVYLPYGAGGNISSVSAGAITALYVPSLGAWTTDPSGPVSPIKVLGNTPSTNGALSLGTGATFTFTGITSASPTADGVHPSATVTRYVRQDFSAKAAKIFVVQ